MVCRMMSAQRVYEGAIPHKPALIDMTAVVHELVGQIHAGRGRNQQPANIGRN